jgi:hypothetical protein
LGFLAAVVVAVAVTANGVHPILSPVWAFPSAAHPCIGPRLCFSLCGQHPLSASPEAADDDEAEMDWHQIAKMKVADLREKAKAIPEVGAVSGMSKGQLVEAVAHHLGIERPHKVAEGIDKAKVKTEIRDLKTSRDEAQKARDPKELKRVRREIHKRKRTLRRHAHLA